MSNITVKILVVLALLSMSALFSCSETAFFSLTRAEINRFKHSKRRYARRVIKLLQRPRETLIAILLGNESVNVALAVVVASLVHDLMGPVNWKVSTAMSVLIATPAILVFGEIVPKNVAVRLSPSLVPFLSAPIQLFSLVTFPVRVILTLFADKIVTLFGGDPSKVRSMIMEEEFRQLVELGHKEGAIEDGELELIRRVFELGNKRIAEIMTPVNKMFCISLREPIDRIVQKIRSARFNRVPVYRNTPEDIIGVMHSRDVFKLYRGIQQGRMQNIDEIIRPVEFVAADEFIEDVLSDFQKTQIHMGIVLDHKMRVVGLVTMDDIFRLLFTQKLDDK